MCSKGLAAIESLLVEFYGLLTNGWVGTDGVVGFVGHSRAFKADCIQFLAKTGPLVDIKIKQGNFHPVEAHCFETFNHR